MTLSVTSEYFRFARSFSISSVYVLQKGLSVGIREDLWLIPQIELGQVHVPGTCDLNVARRSHDHPNVMSGALRQRRFVGAHEAVRSRLVEYFLDDAVVEALRSLRHYYTGSRNRGFDNCPF